MVEEQELMAKDRHHRELQVERAKASLDRHVDARKKKGVEGKALERDPVWRKLNARLHQATVRVRAITALETLEQKLKQVRAEAASQPKVKKARETPAPDAKPAKAAKAKAPPAGAKA
jgi:hypothetical protein